MTSFKLAMNADTSMTSLLAVLKTVTEAQLVRAFGEGSQACAADAAEGYGTTWTFTGGNRTWTVYSRDGVFRMGGPVAWELPAASHRRMSEDFRAWVLASVA